MAKQTGIYGRLYAQNYDISGDTGAIDSIAQSRAMLDVTGIDKDHYERLPGLGDGSIAFTAFFNTSGAHAALSGMGTGAKIVTATFGVTSTPAVGDTAASLSGSEESYNTNRGQDGSLVAQSQFQSFAGYGIEWGNLLTAGTVSATGTGTSYNNGAASSAGGAAYLHVFSVTAGTVTVVIQDSADNSSFANVGGMAFTATAAGTAERVASTSGTAIRQYARYSISGGTAVIAVNLHRNN